MDMTQLRAAMSLTPRQRKEAKEIYPIRTVHIQDYWDELRTRKVVEEVISHYV